MAGIDGISFSGIASGLDTKAIVDALVELEKKPAKLALSKQNKLKSVAGLYGTLATKLKALKEKAAALKLVSQAIVYAASSSDPTKVTAVATSAAQPGTHEITVTQLAQADRELGGAKNGGTYANADTATVGTGSLSITYAGTTTAVDVTGKTLNEVAAEINGASLGVSASVMNVGTSESPSYKLVVSGQETGSTKSISIAVDAGVDLEFTQLTTAQDALLTVDGVPITRSSNTVGDVISGVTLDLKDEGTVTVTLTQDSSAVKKKIEELVEAYNDVVELLNANAKYDAATKVAGPLFGDAAAKQIGGSLTSIALGNGATYAAEEAFDSLAIVGITLQGDGTLSIDEAKLGEKIGQDAGAVLDLFGDRDGAGPDTGIAVGLHAFADDATTGADALIPVKQKALQDQIANLQKTIDKTEKHAAKVGNMLTMKFAKFEQLMGQLKQQQAALLAKFGSSLYG